MTPTEVQARRLPLGHRAIIAFLATKLVWDVITIARTWPDFSRPKLGIAVGLPVILWGLLRRHGWAMNLAGVVCLFWIAFVVARLVAPIVTIGEIREPWPWSNLLAFPAIVYVLQNLRPDPPGTSRVTAKGPAED
jgi:hypothetical protein